MMSSDLLVRVFICLATVGCALLVKLAKNDCTSRRCLLRKNELKFMILGDWGGLPVWPYFTPAQRKVAKAMGEIGSSEITDFQLALGDNFYAVGVKNNDDKRFSATFEKIYTHSALRITPWYILAGNHDHNGNETAQLAYSSKSDRWTFPDLFYVIRYQLIDGTKIDIIMIDTVILCGQTRDGRFNGLISWLMAPSIRPNSPKNRMLADERWRWIEDQLNKSEADYIFIAGHYPVYSTADEGPTPCLGQQLDPLMEKYKVSAYLAGHDHNLQHLQIKKNKTILNYVISGAGAFTSVSTANVKNIPLGSNLFRFPTSSWFSLLNKAGFATSGGFVLAEMNRFYAKFTYFDGKKQHLYSFHAYPRKNANETFNP